jgi:hypothetical protein
MIFQGIFGNLQNPMIDPTTSLGYVPLRFGGLVKFINNIIMLLTAVAGIWVVFNFIAAGYIYLTANGAPQKITDAGNKILQSVIGLAIVALAYVIAAILGFILYKDATFLLKPTLFKL